MNKTSKIYVAGHRGMVGSAIVLALRDRGYDNIVVCTHAELDLTRQADVESFFNREKPDYVFLAAANVGGILANDTYKADFIYSNIMIAANVIYAAYQHGVKKLLNLGSSCIYPKFALQPMKEEYLLSGSLEPTNEPYSIAKISALKLCRYYNEQYGTNYISVMPTNMYGPNDNFNLETAHVFPTLIRKFHLAKLLKNEDFQEIRRDLQKERLGFNMDRTVNLNNEDSIQRVLKGAGITSEYVMLWGGGEAYREFMHVDDLADASIHLMLNYNYEDIGEMINIGTGNDIKIREFASLVRNIVGFEGEIRFDTAKPDGMLRKLLDISKIKETGWSAKIDLRAGIKQLYILYSSKTN